EPGRLREPVPGDGLRRLSPARREHRIVDARELVLATERDERERGVDNRECHSPVREKLVDESRGLRRPVGPKEHERAPRERRQQLLRLRSVPREVERGGRLSQARRDVAALRLDAAADEARRSLHVVPALADTREERVDELECEIPLSAVVREERELGVEPRHVKALAEAKARLPSLVGYGRRTAELRVVGVERLQVLVPADDD